LLFPQFPKQNKQKGEIEFCQKHNAMTPNHSNSNPAAAAPAASMKKDVSWVVKQWSRFSSYLSNDFLGGPKCVNLAHVINLQKGGTLLLCIALMANFDNFSPTAITYTALHGSYGLCWLLKEVVFPDPKWQVKITVGGAINAVLLVLGPYWFMPCHTIANRVEQSPLLLCTATIVYVIGLFLMIGSDCQKFFVLRERKGLITDGFFRRIRHPNYLGEMMLYGSFAAVSGSPISWGILLWVWIGVFLPNMLNKEASMSRYPQWTAYCKRSGFLFPKIV
jgi:protein-S-isoprenylcysteine O-methyltransferase Ste14